MLIHFPSCTIFTFVLNTAGDCFLFVLEDGRSHQVVFFQHPDNSLGDEKFVVHRILHFAD